MKAKATKVKTKRKYDQFWTELADKYKKPKKDQKDNENFVKSISDELFNKVAALTDPDESSTTSAPTLTNWFSKDASKGHSCPPLCAARPIHRTCQGYSIDLQPIYKAFPFQLLEEIELQTICFENGRFHDKNCATNHYQLNKICYDGVNDCCRNLKYHQNLQKVIKRAKAKYEKGSELCRTNNLYVTYNQLCDKAVSHRINQQCVVTRNIRYEKKNSSDL